MSEFYCYEFPDNNAASRSISHDPPSASNGASFERFPSDDSGPASFDSGPASFDSGPASFDSIFIDDDDEVVDDDGLDDFDDGSFTMINGEEADVVRRRHSSSDACARTHRRISRTEQSTADKMKSKMTSFWNNVRYGWTVKPRTNFRKKRPIFLLSQCYDHRLGGVEMDEATLHLTLVRFRQNFTSRLWFTYRQGFPKIAGSQLKSDCGWGCMLRSGQMILGQAFVTHFIGKDWNLFGKQDPHSEAMHREIIRWFSDRPSTQSPFSIHRLVQIGEKSGRKAGDWYGPASVATILEKAMRRTTKEFLPLLNQVCLYVGNDCTLYKQDIIDLCTGGGMESSSGAEITWKSVVILVPVRLGTESLNEIYIPCLKGLFVHENFLGIIGGRPRHSLYFVGFQEEKLIHLDPHLVQDYVDPSPRDFPTQSYHCVHPRKISFTSMDPSCTLGFYCRTKGEFDNFLNTVQPYLIPPGQANGYPLFVVSEGSRADHF